MLGSPAVSLFSSRVQLCKAAMALLNASARSLGGPFLAIATSQEEAAIFGNLGQGLGPVLWHRIWQLLTDEPTTESADVSVDVRRDYRMAPAGAACGNKSQDGHNRSPSILTRHRHQPGAFSYRK